jgi:hypothetical protein
MIPRPGRLPARQANPAAQPIINRVFISFLLEATRSIEIGQLVADLGDAIWGTFTPKSDSLTLNLVAKPSRASRPSGPSG